jgi:hypothetical protein
VEPDVSIVFLSGQRALKLKRTVRYDYLDFPTIERRRAMCEAELRINRRTAPGSLQTSDGRHREKSSHPCEKSRAKWARVLITGREHAWCGGASLAAEDRDRSSMTE